MRIRNVSQAKWVIPLADGKGFKVLHPDAVMDVNDKSHPIAKKLAENYPRDFIALEEATPKKAKPAAE